MPAAAAAHAGQAQHGSPTDTFQGSRLTASAGVGTRLPRRMGRSVGSNRCSA